jgi:hypothetical protein
MADDPPEDTKAPDEPLGPPYLEIIPNPQPAAVEDWDARRIDVNAIRVAFKYLCKKYSREEAEQIWLEAAGMTGGEFDNAELLRWFIYEKSVTRQAGAGAGKQRPLSRSNREAVAQPCGFR